MRCSAKRVTKHKVTFSFVNGSASGTYTSSVGYADTCLAAARVSSSSASGTAGLGSHREPIQYRAPASQPSRGRLSRVVPRGSPGKKVFPRTRKLSPLCTTSLLFFSPGLPVLRGVSGGGAALSSLCRRFPGGDIMNLTSRRSPLSVLSCADSA